MEHIAAQYIEIWTAYYAANPFAGTCAKAAAEFAAMDCINTGKRGGWTEADFLDDLEYWKSKI